MTEKIEKGEKEMFGKINIKGSIESVTGLHIGESSAFAAIGAVDSPVIRDVRTRQPIIPGSSLKGKMRTLLAQELNTDFAVSPDNDCEAVLRLFGSAEKSKPKKSRILISDMFLENEAELRNHGLQSMTEVKFENTINRLTAVANPRQIERVVRGAEFGLDMIYNVSKDVPENEIFEDFSNIAEGMKLLEYDYLGGSGSRGYGKILFKNVNVSPAVGNFPAEFIDKLNTIISDKLK